MKWFKWIHMFVNNTRKKNKSNHIIHHINGANGLETNDRMSVCNEKSSSHQHRSLSLGYNKHHRCHHEEKGQYLNTSFVRSQSLRMSKKVSPKDTLSLRRIGSFGSRLLPLKKKDSESVDESNSKNNDCHEHYYNDQPCDPGKSQSKTFCIYTEMYQQLDNNGGMNKIPETNVHPKLIKYSKMRKETLFLSKKCHICNEPGSIFVIQSLNNTLFKQLLHYYKIHENNEKLRNISFYLDGINFCLEPIKSEVFRNFSEKFGPTLKKFKFLTKYEDLSTVIQFNNNITATLLQMLYINNEYYKNLVDFEILITDKAIGKFFCLFISSYTQQIEYLTIKFFYEKKDFHVLVTDVIDSLSMILNLKHLRIELLPVSNQTIVDNSIDLSNILRKIADSAQKLTNVENFSLAVDVNYVQHENLKLIECLSAFTNANSFSLVIYHDPRLSNLSDLYLNFDSFANNDKLKQLNIDCTCLSNDDVERLVINCPNLTRLSIGCDNRIDQISIDAITKYLSRLETLSIGGASSYQNNKQGLYIDNSALNVLLSNAPQRLRFLRTIKLANCRIIFENSKSLIEKLRSFALSKPDELFKLILENNRFALMEEIYFREKYEIPANMDLEWIYKRTKQETQL